MSCREYEVLLSLRAAGALDASEAARVEGHLARCPECTRAADDAVHALSLAALPPVSAEERHALRELPVRTLAALRIAGDRRSLGKEIVAVLAVVAAAMIVVLAPAVVRKPAEAPPAPEVSWQQPDLDGIWDDTGVLDLAPSSEGGRDEPVAAALAALDL